VVVPLNSAFTELNEDGSERANILVVDDLPDKLFVLDSVLSELGQNLVFARSGAAALRAVLNQEFAVILLDVNMPDIDGIETASLIRQYRRSAHTPIIFITAYADEMQTLRGYSLGAVDYIVSPVVPEVLRSKVKVFVELHLMHRRVRRQADEQIALAAARSAQAVAEANTRRSNFLSHASRVLSSSLDVAVGMRSLLELLVPEHAPSACLVLCDGEGAFERSLALRPDGAAPGELGFDEDALPTLPDAQREALARAVNERRSVQLSAESGVAGGPVGIVLPLIVAERATGALLLQLGDPRPDLPTLEELAMRAAICFDNGRLYHSLQTEIVERREAEQQLEESHQRKDEFLAMLSHELRNPLATIRTSVEVIRRVAPRDAQLSRAVEVSQRQVGLLAGLVDELLDVARISRGKITLRSDPVDLVTVLAQGVETVRPFIDARKHVLAVRLPDAPVWLRGDFARLSQVVGNLLHNAAKYSDEGGRIELSLTVQDGHAEITVRDQGIGIEPELLPHVFELFEQGRRSLDRSQGGLGVGLTLVQRLVRLHNGRVEAHSAGPGQGSAFRVVLPCMAEVAPARSVAAEPTPLPGPGRCKVLVVDDNRDAAETVATYLGLLGYEVRAVFDGPQALACAETYAPDAVVLDIGLPQMDGYEVARRLRALPATRSSLFIALTGYGQQSDVERTRAAGIEEHLVKPADPGELAGLIARWYAARPAAVAAPRSVSGH
jgi:signal transduction histidine kinase